MEDESYGRLRPYESVLARHGWMQNRGIIKPFDGLRVTDSFQLQDGWRDMLMRRGGAGRPVI